MGRRSTMTRRRSMTLNARRDGARPMRLEDLRVVDLTGGLAGAYCTKLLADAGADVVVVESVGDGARWPETPGLFAFLQTSKRSVRRGHEAELVRSADIVVAGTDLDVAAARRSAPSQVVVTISPFGSSGPWVGRPATEFTLEAACGSTGGRGLPGQTPLSAGGRLGEWMAGTYAAVGALSGWWRASRTGEGDHVDVALLDCMAVSMVTFPSVFAEFALTCGRPPMFAASRKIEVPSIEPTADGWVNFTTNSAQQFADFSLLIGQPDLGEDERYARATQRFAHREEFWEMTRAYTRPRSSAVVLDEAGLLRIPVAPVLDGSTVLEFEQFVARGVFVEHPSGQFRQPRIPYRLHGVAPRPFGPVPEAGAHDGTVDWGPRPPTGRPTATTTTTTTTLPLAGVRVVDLTAWWAGPCATNALACLGADVIKVESVTRPDLMRFSSTKAPGDPQWWEWGPLAHAANTNKRGITLDLSRPEGHGVALRLLATADLVFENFTPRVMEQFDLDWDRLHQVNPGLSLVRMPAFGLDGPWRNRPGFAQTMESLTGMAALTGWPDGSPVLVGGAGDPIAGLHATFASLVALCARDESDHGYLVEATMVEAALNAAAMSAITTQLTGTAPRRLGNRSRIGSVPQGVYRCAGLDDWVAIEVTNDDQWGGLCDVIGRPGDDPPDRALAGVDLTKGSARQLHEEALDGWLSAATLSWDAEGLVRRLVEVGVPAAVVIPPAQVAENPQLVHRGLFETEHHPVTGQHKMPGLPFSLTSIDHWIRTAAPVLGQHNDEILGELGLDATARQALRSQHIIGEDLIGA
jgi:crotonobetainyl-CoA:carnitine CoA-transferase CaiB-like acyl-CoA transferase